MSRHPLLLVLLVVLVAGCAEPPLTEPDDEVEGAESPVELEDVEPAQEALRDELAVLTELVTEARSRLAAARDVDDLDAARAAGHAALALLVVDPDLEAVDLDAQDLDGADPGAVDPADVDTTEDVDPADGVDGPEDAEEPADVDDAPPAEAGGALFPAESPERGDPGAGQDQLTQVLTVAREAGGLGREVTEVLRQHVAGDLGAWQRDAEGMLALVRTTAIPGADLADLEAAVLELPGDGTRALVWALLTSEADSGEDATAYAERGMAHLEAVLAALDLVDGAGTETS